MIYITNTQRLTHIVPSQNIYLCSELKESISQLWSNGKELE